MNNYILGYDEIKFLNENFNIIEEISESINTARKRFEKKCQLQFLMHLLIFPII
jgi:hypothetical protein